MYHSIKSLLVYIITCIVLLQLVMTVKLESGELYITVSQENQQNSNHKVSINSKAKNVLELTQSSKLKIQAKLTFSSSEFKPQLLSFRLRHNKYQNLTQPVLAQYNPNLDNYIALIDLGDPRQIKPFTDKYQLEVILGDDQLDQNIRNVIADCNIKFRKSLETIPDSDLHYKTQNIIETAAPTQRVDPPQLFTFFVVIMILVLDAILVYGLMNLNANVKLFPTSSSGFIINVALLAVLMANLSILIKFWINWTFLDTLQYILILILPTALVANYALIHVKKH